jgi:hypothetical protein
MSPTAASQLIVLNDPSPPCPSTRVLWEADVEWLRDRSSSCPVFTASADFALIAGLLPEKLKVALRERMLICIVILQSTYRRKWVLAGY